MGGGFAIREAKRLNIPTVALIDTDSDPSDIDLPIPGNDDGIRSVELIMRNLADAVNAGFEGVWGNNPPFEVTIDGGVVTSARQIHIP